MVSLVPSTTETLAELGLGERVVGRTRYCVHPRPWVDGVVTVGGTKDVDAAAVAALEPDLIIGNEEENVPARWPELEAVAPLYVAYPRTVDEAVVDLRRLSTLVGAAPRGQALADAVEDARVASPAGAFRYACLIWHKPWMVVNDDTFIASMLSELGGENVFGDRPERYAQVSLADLEAADPRVVVLPSEPFPFEERHAERLGSLALRARFVDGEMLSWHGTRMIHALPYLRKQQASWGDAAGRGARRA
jgi:ABC-type Fe3+-hydroxamate transport system substrate-binding protein